MNLIVLGPQGCGKGTQAELLVKKYGFFHMESGQLLREVAKTDPRINDMINVKGELVPDTETIELIEKHIQEKHSKFDQLIFDGFPRTQEQYQLLKTWIAEKNSAIHLAIYMNISEEETVRRLSARRQDSETGATYNLITNPPPADVPQERLIQRDDDKPEIIKRRLDIYHTRTQPIIEDMKKDGILFEVNGEQPIDVIFAQLASKIEELQNEEK